MKSVYLIEYRKTSLANFLQSVPDGEVKIQVQRIEIHPDYNPSKVLADLAIFVIKVHS